MKSIKNLITKEEKEQKPFYIDEARLKSETKNFEQTRQTLSRVVDLYSKLNPAHPINSIKELKAFVSDPKEFYCSWRIKQNEVEKNQFQEWALKGGFSLEKLKDELIHLPEGFDEIVSLSSRVASFRTEYFILTNGEVSFSNEFTLKLVNKVYYFATTPEQKARLEYAEKLKETLEALQPLLEIDAKEAGLRPERVEETILSQSHIGGLPYCLRLKHDPTYRNPRRLSLEKKILEVNPEWVIHGFKPFASAIGLPEYNRVEARPDDHYERFKLLWRTDFDGGRRVYVIPSNQSKLQYLNDPLGLERSVISEEEYIFKGGKLRRVWEG